MAAKPYSTSPVFDERTLPAAIQTRHDTKAGVWALIRILEGSLKLTYLDPPAEVILTPERPGITEPQQVHFVTVLGPVQAQVEFYRERPEA